MNAQDHGGRAVDSPSQNDCAEPSRASHGSLGMVSIPLTLLRRLIDAIETTHCNGDGDEYNIDENCDLQKQAEKYLR